MATKIFFIINEISNEIPRVEKQMFTSTEIRFVLFRCEIKNLREISISAERIIRLKDAYIFLQFP